MKPKNEFSKNIFKIANRTVYVKGRIQEIIRGIINS
jgi:hypothetical protein